MARIRRYDTFPALFVPDEGEIVLAARSPAGPFLRAAVRKVRRASRDRIRVDFTWAEDGPGAINGTPIIAWQTRGHVYIALDDRVPLIRRIPAEPAPRLRLARTPRLSWRHGTDTDGTTRE